VKRENIRGKNAMTVSMENLQNILKNGYQFPRTLKPHKTSQEDNKANVTEKRKRKT